MTREMNKPEWEQKYYWQCVDYDVWIGKQRVLNPDIAEFVNELNLRLENK